MFDLLKVKHKIGTITVQEWKNVCDQAVKEEKKCRQNAVLGDIIERILFLKSLVLHLETLTQMHSSV